MPIDRVRVVSPEGHVCGYPHLPRGTFVGCWECIAEDMVAIYDEMTEEILVQGKYISVGSRSATMERHVVYTAIVKANRQANEELFRHQQSVLEKPPVCEMEGLEVEEGEGESQ